MEGQNDSRSLRAYWQTLRLRSRLILFIVIVTAASAVLFSLRQSPLYEATSQVYFKNQSLTVSQAGAVTPHGQHADGRPIDPDAGAAGADDPVATRPCSWNRVSGAPAPNTPESGRASVSAQKLLDDSSVAPDPNADIISIQGPER